MSLALAQAQAHWPGDTSDTDKGRVKHVAAMKEAKGTTERVARRKAGNWSDVS